MSEIKVFQPFDAIYNNNPHSTKHDIINIMEIVRKHTIKEFSRKAKAEPFTEWGGEDGRVPNSKARLIIPNLDMTGIELIAKIEE